MKNAEKPKRELALPKWDKFGLNLVLNGGSGKPLYEGIQACPATSEFYNSGLRDALLFGHQMPEGIELSAQADAIRLLYTHFAELRQKAQPAADAALKFMDFDARKGRDEGVATLKAYARTQTQRPVLTVSEPELRGAIEKIPLDDLTRDLLRVLAEHSTFPEIASAARLKLEK